MKKLFLYLLFFSAIGFSAHAQSLITPTYVDSVPMRDGKKLAVDIYIPDNGGGNAYPVILVQTPYNRVLYRTVGLPLFGNNIASAHYAMVIADWRCFYGSAAACAGNYDRAKDGYDLVEWIATRPWSNGKVGTWGPSALGRIQFQTARTRPPHLLCCVPLVAGPQYSYPEYFQGGDYRTEYVQQLDALGFGVSATLLAHPTHDISWTYSEFINYYPDSINVPMLMIGGWYDHNTEVMLDFFGGIRQSSFTAVRDKHRLLMGPWTHGGHGTAGIGAPQQGALYYYDAVGWSDSLALLHFNYYLRQVSNGWNSTPYIQYFQMGENNWQNTASWPPSGVSNQTLYLQDNLSITTALPVSPGIYQSLTYDPHNPSPTTGGSTLRSDQLQGPYDQALAVESRNDVLSFTSAAFVNNVVMKGKGSVHLFVASDRKDCDFAVRLTDVYPDGKSMLVSDGIRRMRFRDGFTAADTSSMVSGQVYEAVIDLPDVALTFLTGHKLRVDVTSSNYPRFDCNLNNGKTMYAAGDTLIASNKVYVGSDHASYMQLPLNGFFVGVEENKDEANKMEVYPNPSREMIHIVLPSEETGEVKIVLTDAMGKMVRTETYKMEAGSSQHIVLSTHDLPAGLYSISVKGNNSTFATKIIIEK
ncbi:MAG: CocE/NonD family hydrolase [Bacteroidota bacterium]